MLADAYGDTVALFERECSIQRRHQKIIEEAPSPDRDPGPAGPPGRGGGRRGPGRRLCQRRHRRVRRRPADGDPYFLEMNTRLQVEHPVTEAVTGLDLVRLQLLIAGGAPLPAEVHHAVAAGPRGHAIEARLYAEDPAQRWLPSTGTLHRFEVGDRPGRGRPGGQRGRVGQRGQPALRPHAGQGHRPRPDPGRGRLRAGRPRWPEPASTGSTTNRDLLVRTLRHPASWPATPTPASSTATALERAGRPPGRRRRRAAPRRGRRPGRPGRPPGRGPGAADHPLRVPQQPVRRCSGPPTTIGDGDRSTSATGSTGPGRHPGRGGDRRQRRSTSTRSSPTPRWWS